MPNGVPSTAMTQIRFSTFTEPGECITIPLPSTTTFSSCQDKSECHYTDAAITQTAAVEAVRSLSGRGQHVCYRVLLYNLLKMTDIPVDQGDTANLTSPSHSYRLHGLWESNWQ